MRHPTPIVVIPTCPAALDTWSRALAEVEIPVLAHTAARIEQAATQADDLDLTVLSDVVSSDPLLTVRLLRDAAAWPRGPYARAPRSASEALMLMGLRPFFSAYRNLPTVQQWLADRPDALIGLTRVVVRDYRAARLAHGFATHLDDPDAALLHEVALVNDFAEMLLWIHAPDLMQQVRAVKHSRLGMRSHDAQLEVLGVDLHTLGYRLMEDWKFPGALLRLEDACPVCPPQARMVGLAVRLARHTRADWTHPEIAAETKEASELLHLSLGATRNLLKRLV